MKKCIWKYAAGAAVMTMVLSGCGTAKGQEPDETKSCRSVTRVQEPESIDFEDWDARRALQEANPVSEKFIGAVNRFSYASAAQLLRTGTDTKNQNYSPLSLYYALALAAQGSEGSTEEELLKLLGMEDKAALADECGKLFRRLYIDHKVSKQKLANSLWLKKGQNFRKKFLKTAQDDFYTSVFEADFENPETGKAMGRWISDQTGGTLAPELKTYPEEALAIINTVYLYDEWQQRFMESANTKDTFTTASGEQMTCEYMNRKFDFHSYYKGDGYTGTALGLKGAGSMVFILPDEGVEIKELLTEDSLRDMFGNRERESATVTVSLPKFRFEDSMELIPVLQEMGLLEAFEALKADFSSMTDEQIFISEVKQETHIEVVESGVEASAYTEIAMAAGAAMTEEKNYELKYNRPFLFGIISDVETPLFIGICNMPNQA